MARTMSTDRSLASVRRWDTKLRARGHRLRWDDGRKTGSGRRFTGTCARCGGEIDCGNGRAQVSGLDGACRPRGLRLIFGGR